MKSEGTFAKISGWGFLFSFQILMCIIFAFATDYDEKLLPSEGKNSSSVIKDEHEHVSSYPHFQDIHVMIFIGFAFLMTFLKKYGYSATGFNYLLGGLLIQWAILMRGCYELEDGKIRISMDSMIGAEIAVASVLISMGALLGRTTPMQLVIMGICEIAVFAANEFFQLEILKVTDAGGSITVHSFGAYFGLAVSFILRPKKGENTAGPHEGPTYTSDLFAMLGSIFLWIYWPSFNSVLVDGPDQQRAILNTYLSLGAATVTTFAFTVMLTHEKKLDMVYVQNATLAGGVAVGSVCNLMIRPHGAIIIGITSGIVSVLGYRYLTPIIYSKLRISDTCGVHNLHGMPAVLSAIFSAFYAAIATEKDYKGSLYKIFPARTPREPQDLINRTLLAYNSTALNRTFDIEEFLVGERARCAECQGGYQILAVLSTILIAITAGIITGFIIKGPSVKRLPKEKIHDDTEYWEVPE